MPQVSEGIRRATRDAARDAGGGWRRDVTARRLRDAAGIFLTFELQLAAGTTAGTCVVLCVDCWTTGPNQSCAFVEIQLNRWRVSQNRPGFDFAPSTTTAT